MVKWAVLVLVACQNHDTPAPRVETGSGSAAVLPIDAGTAPDPESLIDARVKVDEPEPPPDPGKQIAALGAIPAWQAVVDRGLYLDRRDQHGVVYGTLGDPITESSGSGDAMSVQPTMYSWLIDDTDGNGALAIRVTGTAQAKPGDRIALAGAWALDDKREWYWKTTLLTALAPTVIKYKDPPAAPGHAIVNGELPNGARTISLGKEGDAVYFTVVGAAPLADGDGWPVADELGNPVYALLNMPGERASFGGQDFRTPSERWTLKRGQTYWVRIGPVHKHGPDKPATIFARTPPVRVK